MDRHIDPVPRFWAKVRKTRGCWEWTGAKYPNGYGAFARRHGSVNGAHRFSYEIAHGPIPKNLSVLHRCDNRICVKPEHLFLGDQRDNVRDGIKKKRIKTKLAELQVLAMRLLYKHTPLSQPALSRMFHVTKSTVSAIVENRTWRQ
jgi:hypothetical protein